MAEPLGQINGCDAAFAALTGAIILRFARLENALSFELRNHLESHVGKKGDGNKGFLIASAVYGGIRFKQSSVMIKRLAEQERYPLEYRGFLDEFFQHLGHIAGLRDKLAHQLVFPAHGQWDGVIHVVDAFNTHAVADYKRFEFDHLAMGAASTDLWTAITRIEHRLLKRKGSRKTLDPTNVEWSYKPSMLKLVRRKASKSIEAHQPQQRP